MNSHAGTTKLKELKSIKNNYPYAEWKRNLSKLSKS